METNQNLSFIQAMAAATEKCLVRRSAWPDTLHGVLSISEGTYELPVNGRNRTFLADSYNILVRVRSDGGHVAGPYLPSSEDQAANDWYVWVY